jgi:hypothetical protein
VYEARELVAQRNILGNEICTIPENGSNDGENPWALERRSQEKVSTAPLLRMVTRARFERATPSFGGWAAI